MSKESKYMVRALKSHDPRFARVLGKMGYGTRQLVAEPPTRIEEPPAPEPDPAPVVQDDETPALRAEYENLYGKRPFMGWDAETLRAKIAEAKASE